MPSQVATVAEAVKDFLNGLALSQDFTAVRQYAPREDFKDLEDLYVAVAATNRTRSFAAAWATRNKSGKSFPVYVFVVKRLKQETDPAMPVAGGNTEVDDLLAFCEEVDESFVPGPFASTIASVSSEDSTVNVDAEALKQKLFYCVITIPFIYAS